MALRIKTEMLAVQALTPSVDVTLDEWALAIAKAICDELKLTTPNVKNIVGTIGELDVSASG